MDKKLTDSEIKTALKGAILNANGYDSKVWSIEVYKLELALDLINRLQAENESLNLRIFALNDTNKKIMDSQEVYWQNKVKEFAERLKEKAFIILHHKMILSSDIDNLLKELVGD